MRLSTLPTAFGEKMVMRIFDPETVVKAIDALGFGARRQALGRADHRGARHHPRHRPDRQGKTTTLYSTLAAWPPTRSTSAPWKTRSR